MLAKRDSQISHGILITCHGTKLDQVTYQKLKNKLEKLKDRCPYYSSLELKLEKRKSCVVGELSVRSFSNSFVAKKISHDFHQVYLLLEEDIDKQLLDWKRTRFSNQLASTLDPKDSFCF